MYKSGRKSYTFVTDSSTLIYHVLLNWTKICQLLFSHTYIRCVENEIYLETWVRTPTVYSCQIYIPWIFRDAGSRAVCSHRNKCHERRHQCENATARSKQKTHPLSICAMGRLHMGTYSRSELTPEFTNILRSIPLQWICFILYQQLDRGFRGFPRPLSKCRAGIQHPRCIHMLLMQP